MNKSKIIGIILLIIMGTACEDDSVSTGGVCSVSITTDEANLVTARTCNVIDESFYLDLTTKSEVSSNGNWHISFQMIDVPYGNATYPMPSLVLNSNTGIAAAMYENITFDDMSSVPTTFSSPPYSDALADFSTVQYGGDNEVIGYDVETHITDINNPDAVLLIYDPSYNHITWKIQFSEYDSGIILFKFVQL